MNLARATFLSLFITFDVFYKRSQRSKSLKFNQIEQGYENADKWRLLIAVFDVITYINE